MHGKCPNSCKSCSFLARLSCTCKILHDSFSWVIMGGAGGHAAREQIDSTPLTQILETPLHCLCYCPPTISLIVLIALQILFPADFIPTPVFIAHSQHVNWPVEPCMGVSILLNKPLFQFMMRRHHDIISC